jgi:hypothetical protein
MLFAKNSVKINFFFFNILLIFLLNYKKHICGLQSIIDKCRICGTEGETIEHIISSCTVLAQSEYKNVMIYSQKLYT